MFSHATKCLFCILILSIAIIHVLFVSVIDVFNHLLWPEEHVQRWFDQFLLSGVWYTIVVAFFISPSAPSCPTLPEGSPSSSSLVMPPAIILRKGRGVLAGSLSSSFMVSSCTNLGPDTSGCSPTDMRSSSPAGCGGAALFSFNELAWLAEVF